MAYRKRFRKRRYRRKNNKRRRKKKTFPVSSQMTKTLPQNVYSGFGGFPPTRKAIHPYVQNSATLSSPGTGSAAAFFVYSANGMFDPDITGVGHQPKYFDQYTPIYDHYTVIGSQIRVDFVNETPGTEAIVGIRAVDNSVGSATGLDILESNACVWKVLPGYNNGNRSHCTLSLNLNPAKFLGRSKPMSDPQLKGSSSSNPTEQVYFHIFIVDTQGAVSTVRYTTQLSYAAVWHERKMISGS